MIFRTTLLAAGVASIALSSPLVAQDYGAVETGTYDGTWEGDWESDDAYRGVWHGTYTDSEGQTVDAQYRGTFIDEAHFVSEDGRRLRHDGANWHEGGGRHHGEGNRGGRHRNERSHGGHDGYRDVRDLPASPDGRLAYTLTEREAWLADCRILMGGGGGGYAYRDERGGAEGPLVGGLLGAVVGGVVGNRRNDSDRLAGTLIGAGVGGLAGAALGALVDAVSRGDDDDYYEDDYIDTDELYAARYCDAYLRRYEMGGGAGFMQAQPVMLVAAAHGSSGHRHGPECRTIVTEEWIEIEEAPPPPARRTVPPRAAEPQGGKLTPL